MNNLETYMSEKLRGLRAEKKLTYENIAEKINVHRETFRKYETKPFTMNVGMLLEILEIYGVDPNIFFETIYGKLPNDNLALSKGS